jgi:hypothetical protein
MSKPLGIGIHVIRAYQHGLSWDPVWGYVRTRARTDINHANSIAVPDENTYC